MKLRKTLTANEKYNSENVKALALCLFMVKNQHSTVKDFSYRKLVSLSGISFTTVKKRVETLKALKLVEINGNTIVFKTPKSKHGDRNFNLCGAENTIESAITVKDYEKIVGAIITTLPIRRKEFAKKTISTRNNPKNLAELKKAKRLCRKFGWEGKNYEEWGISYDGIKKGVTEGTMYGARKGIERAVQYGLINKSNNVRKSTVSLDFVGSFKQYHHYLLEEGQCTFSFIDEKKKVMKVFKVDANTYTVNEGWC